MPFTITVNKEDNFIEVRYIGKVTLQEIQQVHKSRSDLAHEHNINYHLVDCYLIEEAPDLQDLYLAAQQIRPIIGDDRLKKIAMVIPLSENVAVEMLYFVMKARYHNVHIEMFNNCDTAKRWLNNAD